MWPELREQLAVEAAQLEYLFEVHRPLLEQCRERPPTAIELSALAAFLHSFYTGAENLFRRITLELGDSLPQGEIWHQRLLDSMTKSTARRPAVLTPELASRLKPYLQFRHVFRNSYTYLLRWEKMQPLALESEAVCGQLLAAIGEFEKPRDAD